MFHTQKWHCESFNVGGIDVLNIDARCSSDNVCLLPRCLIRLVGVGCRRELVVYDAACVTASDGKSLVILLLLEGKSITCQIITPQMSWECRTTVRNSGSLRGICIILHGCMRTKCYNFVACHRPVLLFWEVGKWGCS